MPVESQNQGKKRAKNWNEEDSTLLIRSFEHIDQTKTCITSYIVNYSNCR